MSLEDLRAHIEREYTAIQAQYDESGSTMPVEVQEMARHLEQMHVQTMQMHRRMHGATHMMHRNGGMMGLDEAAADTVARAGAATREWHQQMMAMHDAMAGLQQDDDGDSLAARHRRMMRYHEQIMARLPRNATTGATDTTAAQAPDGAALYARECAACHGQQGQGAVGIFPPMSGSALVVGDPGDLVRVVLHGLEGPITVRGERYTGVMPAYEARLSDAEIAAILTHIRSVWGNESGAIASGEVSDIREQYGERIEPWSSAELRRERDRARGTD